tara:strand:- start:32 stop:226 length:195 start_codon:yes stop_codon:yes gene_type:complete
MVDLLAIYQHYAEMDDEELMQNLNDDPLVSQDWLQKVLNNEKVCKSRCFYCILWNVDSCIPKNK